VTSTEKNLAVNRLIQLRSEYGLHKDAEKPETIRNGTELNRSNLAPILQVVRKDTKAALHCTDLRLSKANLVTAWRLVEGVYPFAMWIADK